MVDAMSESAGLNYAAQKTLHKCCATALQYCAKVMQTIIDEYREYRDISAIFNEILP